MPAAACRIAPEAAEGPEVEEPTAPFIAAAAIFRDAANRRSDLCLQPLPRRKWGLEVEPKAGGVATTTRLRPPRCALRGCRGGVLGARPLMNMLAGAPPAVS